jgi:hypothetical protein
MDDRVKLQPQLPQLREQEAYAVRIVQQGAQPLPTFELQTKVPDLGPITLGSSGFYDLQAYPGPLLRVVSAPPTGQQLDVTA